MTISNTTYTPLPSLHTRLCRWGFILLLTSLYTCAKAQNHDILHHARQFVGTPYVAHTLDNGKDETVVVNLKQMDCTTFVEYTIAQALCDINGTTMSEEIRQLRYKDGIVAYDHRLHYFSAWIEENTRRGIVKEIAPADNTRNHPFIARQTIRCNYMTTHPALYPQLRHNATLTRQIRDKQEKPLNGKTIQYIPKHLLNDTTLLRPYINDGDIIAIVTNKKGLDTSHIGFAVWQADGLHLLNASQIHKKVIEEPLTLYQYMQQHPTQVGIRVIRVL